MIYAKVYSFTDRIFLFQLADLTLECFTQALIQLTPVTSRPCSRISQLLSANLQHYTRPRDTKDPVRKFLSRLIAIRFTGLLGDEFDKRIAGGDEL